MKEKLNVLLIWLALIFVLIIAPVFAFGFSYSYLQSIRMKNEIEAISQFTEVTALKLRKASNNRKFWCLELSEAFARCDSQEAFDLALHNLSERHQQKMSWLLWGKSGEAVRKNIKSNHSDKTWNRVGEILKRCSQSWFLSLSASDDLFIKQILGQHLQTKILHHSINMSDPDLIDLSFRRPAGALWANFGQNFGAMVILPSGISQKKHGLQNFIRSGTTTQHGYQISLISGKDFYSDDPKITFPILNALKNRFRKSENGIQLINTTLYSARFLNDGSFFCISRSSPHLKHKPARGSSLLALLLTFIFLLASRSIKPSQFAADLSIKYTVIGLIVCANVFPLVTLAVLGEQYLQQKRQILMEEKRVEAINFLHSIETEFAAEINRTQNYAIKHVNALGQTLKKEPLSLKNSQRFRDSMRVIDGRFLVIASTTLPVLSNVVFIDKNVRVVFGEDKNSSIDTIKMNESMSKLGSAFLAFYNGTTLPEKVITEVELVIEAVFQNKLTTMLHQFLGLLDHIEKFGVGDTKSPTFMNFLSLGSDNKADYLFMFIFNLDFTARNFLAERQQNLYANSSEIKVIYAPEKEFDQATVKPFSNPRQFRELFARATHFPQPSPELADIDGETWLTVTFLSKAIANYRLIALSPMRLIERQLSQERNGFLTILLLNILMASGIAFVFVQTLLQPVSILQLGINAIKQREYSFRVPELATNEFGRMSKIFNSAILDLEELGLARNVQQHLFPRSRIETGHFDLYGKTVPMADLGGDYLDYFSIDPDKFAMILGDVAGHGVGAAMIMAMAKAAVLNSKPLLSEPKLLLAKLHDIIYRTKSKNQKKIMTFQYFYVDKPTNHLIYANAGGCSPYIVRAEAMIVEEISLPGPVLGSFKNGKFNETTVSFAPGDALILYTDGIIEACNNAGEMLGFPRFKQMLLDNYSPDSQVFYERLLAAELVWREDQPRHDDISLMILELKHAQ